jgi:hypothetical protein
MQKSYRLDPGQLAKQKRNIILLYGISGIVSGVLMFFSQRAQGADRNPWLLIGMVFILLVYFGYRSYRQRVELWEGYRLTLDEQELTLSQPGYPDSTLRLEKITGVEEGRDGLWLATQQGNRVFIVPNLLRAEDYDEVCEIVRQNVKMTVDSEDEDELELEAIATPKESLDIQKHAVPSEAEGLDDLSPEDHL